MVITTGAKARTSRNDLNLVVFALCTVASQQFFGKVVVCVFLSVLFVINHHNLPPINSCYRHLSLFRCFQCDVTVLPKCL